MILEGCPQFLLLESLLAGLELVGHKANAWLQTKLNPVLQKQLLAGLKKSCNNWSSAVLEQ